MLPPYHSGSRQVWESIFAVSASLWLALATKSDKTEGIKLNWLGIIIDISISQYILLRISLGCIVRLRR